MMWKMVLPLNKYIVDLTAQILNNYFQNIML